MTVVHQLLADLAQRGITLVVRGGKLLYRPIDAMPADLLALVRNHRDGLVELLSNGAICSQEELPNSLDTHDDSVEYIDPPAACASCRGLMMWWDMVGGVHCLRCDPPATSRRLMLIRNRILAQERKRRRSF